MPPQMGPSALLIEGETGIGKTTIWKSALSMAADRAFRVLTCRPSESEASLSFAALSDLLENNVDGALPALPEPQRAGLNVALLREAPQGAPPSQRAVSVATLGVLRHLARSGPVVIGVDDLQWLDLPTVRVLDFVLRRLGAEPIALVASLRIGTMRGSYLGIDRALPAERVHRLNLGPVGQGALSQIIATQLAVRFPPPTMHRLYEVSGGNPLFGLEIARALQRAGRPAQAGGQLPIPEHLADLLRRRLKSLHAPAREAVLIASALARPTVEVVRAAAKNPDEVATSLEVAEERNTIMIEDGQIRFTHPLLASVAYGAATGRRRRELHATLALTLADPEERARHLALASQGPDEHVATALERAAQEASVRGATDAAAELAELARDRTPPDR